MKTINLNHIIDQIDDEKNDSSPKKKQTVFFNEEQYQKICDYLIEDFDFEEKDINPSRLFRLLMKIFLIHMGIENGNPK